jgi:hypothetical protein
LGQPFTTWSLTKLVSYLAEVTDWCTDHGIELVYTPSNASWLNWVESEFTFCDLTWTAEPHDRCLRFDHDDIRHSRPSSTDSASCWSGIEDRSRNLSCNDAGPIHRQHHSDSPVAGNMSGMCLTRMADPPSVRHR